MMANKAEAGRVASDIRPPNFRAAVQLMRHDIKKKKDRMSGIQGEIADTWAKIEGHKVDKIGAQIFMKLDALEPDERMAAMRSINGLADVAEWPETAEDLVDQAEGKVVELRVGKRDEADAGDDAGGDGAGKGGDAESGAAAKEPQAAALGRARRHLSGGAGQPSDEAPDGEDGRLHT